MTFLYPYLFWIMIIPFVLFLILVTTNKDGISRVFDEKVLERLRVNKNILPNKIRNLVLFAAVFFMIVALARPVINRGDKTVAIKGLSLMSAIDISGSMRSKDVYPNRLEFAKKKLEQLLDDMPTDEVSLAAFAHSSFILSPFTSDKDTLKQMLEGVDESYINMSSTDFSSLGELASRMLEKKKPKILVVVSDGGDKKSLGDFATIIKDNKITLYAILVGTKRGAPVLDSSGKTMLKKDGSIAITQMNEELGKIAKESGGDYIVASNGDSDVKGLVQKMRAKFADKKNSEIKIKDRKELFVYPLLIAVLLLLIGLSSLPSGTQRIQL